MRCRHGLLGAVALLPVMVVVAVLVFVVSAGATNPGQNSGSSPLTLSLINYDYFSAVDLESNSAQPGLPLCDPGSPNATGTCDPSTDVYNPGVAGDPVLPDPFRPVTPTCAWDSDDALSIYGSGYLDTGASASFSFCVIHDSFDHPEYSRHPTHVWLNSLSPTLTVRVDNDYDPSLDMQAPPPALQPDGSWLYQVCFTRRVGVVGQVFPPVPYSNGGTGVPVQTTVRVTNSGAKTVRKLTVYATNGFYNNPYLLWRNAGC